VSWRALKHKPFLAFILILCSEHNARKFTVDEMKKPVKVAGINAKDMCPQK